jgi:hypothetical protein
MARRPRIPPARPQRSATRFVSVRSPGTTMEGNRNATNATVSPTAHRPGRVVGRRELGKPPETTRGQGDRTVCREAFHPRCAADRAIRVDPKAGPLVARPSRSRT